jgi:hypothetical protein
MSEEIYSKENTNLAVFFVIKRRRIDPENVPKITTYNLKTSIFYGLRLKVVIFGTFSGSILRHIMVLVFTSGFKTHQKTPKFNFKFSIYFE